MEVGIRYGVCNNSPAECTSPENGRCSNEPPMVCRHLHIILFIKGSECRVGGRRARVEGLKRELGWIAHLVQILVVVANIQLRTLKAEVEKVSM